MDTFAFGHTLGQQFYTNVWLLRLTFDVIMLLPDACRRFLQIQFCSSGRALHRLAVKLQTMYFVLDLRAGSPVLQSTSPYIDTSPSWRLSTVSATYDRKLPLRSRRYGKQCRPSRARCRTCFGQTERYAQGTPACCLACSYGRIEACQFTFS